MPPPALTSIKTKTHPPVYVICPWDRKPTAISINADDLGSAFFVSGDGGVFVTAKHVVEKYDDNPKVLRVLHVDDPPTRVCELHVTALQLHDEFDLAVGRVALPPSVFLQHLILGVDQLSSGEQVFVFGYSDTVPTDLEPQIEGTLPGFHLAMNPKFYGGQITDFFPDGLPYTRGRVYAHSARTMGGISGGPMLRFADSSVYGITSRGCEEYGTATDIRELLDWPISFLDGRTLRQLGEESRP